MMFPSLQDLQSELKKEQRFKSYKGVKIAKCCEMVTVSRRAAARRRGRSRPTRSKVVATASHVFIEHCLGLLYLPRFKIGLGSALSEV